MVDRRLKQDFRKVMTSMFGEDGAQQRRTVQAVISPDATVNRESLLPVLPWSRADVVLPGVIVAATDLIRLAMPQGARIRHVAIAARVPPSGGPLALRLTSGAESEAISLPAGQTARSAGLDIRVDPGAFIALSVLDPRGAEDATISLHYTVGGA